MSTWVTTETANPKLDLYESGGLSAKERLAMAVDELEKIVANLPKSSHVGMEFRCDKIRDLEAESRSGGWARFKAGRRYLTISIGPQSSFTNVNNAEMSRGTVLKALESIKPQISTMKIFWAGIKAVIEDGPDRSIFDPEVRKAAGIRPMLIELFVDLSD